MINKRGKKAQIQISFNMIFSIILIVVFIAVAVYGIVKFLGIQECAETGLFEQDLQTSIDKAWSSDSSYEIFPKNNQITLPKKIDYICFIDLGKESKGSHADYYSGFESEGLTNHNMFFSPFTEACSGQGSFEIKHIDIEKITENENPYCIANSKIEMKIEKGFGENLVRIKKSTDLTNNDESSGSGGNSNSGGGSSNSGYTESGTCNSNLDCVKQQVTCCPCTAGGQEKCVSKQDAIYWKNKLEECRKDIVCPAWMRCTNIECECIENTCVKR